MEKKKKCPLCNDEIKSIMFNGLCISCAKNTYIIWRDIVGE